MAYRKCACVIARIRIGVMSEPPLGARREKIDPFGKTGRCLGRRGSDLDLTCMPLVEIIVFRRPDPVQREQLAVFSRKLTDRTIPNRIMPWNANRKVPQRNPHRTVSSFAIFCPIGFRASRAQLVLGNPFLTYDEKINERVPQIMDPHVFQAGALADSMAGCSMQPDASRYKV